MAGTKQPHIWRKSLKVLLENEYDFYKVEFLANPGKKDVMDKSHLLRKPLLKKRVVTM